MPSELPNSGTIEEIFDDEDCMGDDMRDGHHGLCLREFIQCLCAVQAGSLAFTQPEKMFEQLFGEDSEADREALRKIKISAEDERKLGEQILEAGRDAWTAEGIKLISKGRDVDYLRSLVDTLRPYMMNPTATGRSKCWSHGHRGWTPGRVPAARWCSLKACSTRRGAKRRWRALSGMSVAPGSRPSTAPAQADETDGAKSRARIRSEQFFKSGPGMIKLMSRPFRPEDERDADRDGAEWAFLAGYDPREMAKLFQRKADQGAGAEIGRGSGTDVFSHASVQPGPASGDSAAVRQTETTAPAAGSVHRQENLKLRKSRHQMEKEK